ncbi:MAG: hypothetical protein Q9170_007863, partial [Blastenia crenularia]
TEEMALKPSNLGWVEAATVPMSAVTAWQALFTHAGVAGIGDPVANRGKRVLVIAAAGGVGVWVIQLARMAGMDVIAQVGDDDGERAALVRELGAKEMVNYHAVGLKEWADEHGQVDVVVDCVGGETLIGVWWVVREGGRLISIVGPPEEWRPKELRGKEVENLFFIMTPDGGQLGEVSKLIEQGKARAVVDSVWDFGEYEGAFKRVDGGHARGKVVVKVRE